MCKNLSVWLFGICYERDGLTSIYIPWFKIGYFSSFAQVFTKEIISPPVNMCHGTYHEIILPIFNFILDIWVVGIEYQLLLHGSDIWPLLIIIKFQNYQNSNLMKYGKFSVCICSMEISKQCVVVFIIQKPYYLISHFRQHLHLHERERLFVT